MGIHVITWTTVDHVTDTTVSETMEKEVNVLCNLRNVKSVLSPLQVEEKVPLSRGNVINFYFTHKTANGQQLKRKEKNGKTNPGRG